MITRLGRAWRGMALVCLWVAAAGSAPALAQVRHEGAVSDGSGIQVLTAGIDHACGILSSGRAMCWGTDHNGKATPPGGEFIELSAGFEHTCGLRGDGTVACWGEGFTAQWPEEPVIAVPEGRFSTLASGAGFTCGLRVRAQPWDYPYGNVECWAASPWGWPPGPPPGDFVSLSASHRQVCGLRADGQAQCWGGNGDPDPQERFIAVTAGDMHACGLRADGSVTCWGDNGEGAATPPAELFTAISSGFQHGCGLRPNGQAQCWGANWAGQADAPLEERFVAISAGLHNTCAVRTDGQVRCWGHRDYGRPFPEEQHRFGYGSIAAGGWHGCQAGAEGNVGCWGSMNPHPVSPQLRLRDIDGSEGIGCAKGEDGVLACFGWENEISQGRPTEPVRQFALGHRHACAVLGLDGRAHCWGWDINEQNQAPAGAFRHVSAGLAHSCGVNDAGQGACWGYNGDGQGNPPPTPPEVRYLTISAGDRHSCGLTSDQRIRCWGQIDMLPPGNPEDPETDPWFATFRTVASGANHACAVRTNGRVVCWGANWSGQSQPPEGTFVSLSAGTDHTCGIRSNGSRECWGAPYLAPRLKLNPEFLPGMRPGQWLSVNLWLENQSQNYPMEGEPRFHLAAGTLPPGFWLDEMGYLHGALHEPGVHPITIEGRDGNGFAARRDYVLSIDETPPVIEPLIQGAAGENGWYTSPVELDWSVTDPESPIMNRHCDPHSINFETPDFRVHCGAESGGGWADREVVLKLDFTPPWVPGIYPSPTNGSMEFKFESQDGLSGVGRFECSVDDAPYVACPSPYLVSAGPGDHTLSVRAVDVAGNASDPNRFTWVGDDTPPQITEIVTGPLGANGWYIGNVGISWQVEDYESPVSSTVGCTPSSLTTDSLGAGYTCWATSFGGTSSRTVTVKRDTVAPQTSFSGALPGNTMQRSAVFYFTGSDATSGVDYFECRINTGAYYRCGSGQTHTVSPGTVVFAVRAVDRAGRRDATPSQHTWVVDDTPPLVVPTIGGERGYDGWFVGPVDISWAVSDAESAVTSTGCNAVTLTNDTLAAEFICTAASVGGTTSRSVVVKLDRTAPQTDITQAPPAQTNATDATFEFGGSDGTSGVRYYECSLDGGPFDLCTSPRTVSVPAQGEHTFQVRSMDHAGHRDATPAAHSWVVDLTPPDIGLDVNGDRAASGWYVGDVQVDWTVNEPTSTATQQGCDDLLLDSDTAGMELTCSATSAGGNASRSVTLRRDAVAPQTTLTAAPKPETGSASATFEFGGSDATSGVLGFECNYDASGYVPCSSPHTISGMPAGEHRMEVRAFDGAGHRDASPEVHEWRIDTTPPEIQPSVYGTQGSNGWLVSDVRIEWAVVDTGSSVSTSGCDTVTVTRDTAGTSYTCTASSAGGSSSRTVTVKRDATAPVVFAAATTAPNAAGWHKTAVTVGFTCSDALSGGVVCPSAQQMSAEGVSASTAFTVRDAAGNEASANVVTVKIDRVAPLLSPTVTPGTLLLNGTATAAANAADANSGIAQQSCAPVATGSIGTRSVSCSAVDVAGNAATGSASYTVVYGFNGFTTPVQNAPVLNVLKAGRSVSLKWRVVDANGAPVSNLASASVTSVSISCPSATQNTITTYGGSNGALQNLGNGYYRLDWMSSLSLRNTCRRLQLNLGDGSLRTAQFKFN